jgi:undecaprenyl pyrophosphate phosphatase UppP
VLKLIEAIFLGVVQGLTEFLPVSSSGHLLLSQYFLGLDQKRFGLSLHRTGMMVMIQGLRGRTPSHGTLQTRLLLPASKRGRRMTSSLSGPFSYAQPREDGILKAISP